MALVALTIDVRSGSSTLGRVARFAAAGLRLRVLGGWGRRLDSTGTPHLRAGWLFLFTPKGVGQSISIPRFVGLLMLRSRSRLDAALYPSASPATNGSWSEVRNWRNSRHFRACVFDGSSAVAITGAAKSAAARHSFPPQTAARGHRGPCQTPVPRIRDAAIVRGSGHRQVTIDFTAVCLLETPYLIAMVFGLAASLFAMRRVRTPSSNLASMRSGSAFGGSEKDRLNEPKRRST